jgi:outer membrane receptor protein involved in Fe transport
MHNLKDKIRIIPNIIFIIIVFLIITIISQNTFAFPKKIDNVRKTFNLYVTVVDSSTDKPLELVNLILQKEGKILDIDITNHSGESIFHDLEPGKYILAIHYIGYKDYSIPVTIAENNSKLKIRLSENAIGLGEVVVTGSRIMHVSNFVDIKTGYQTFEGETFHAPPSARITTLVQENLTGAVRAPTGEVHIRGQHGEYTYYIDGIPIPLGVFGGLNEVVDPKVIKLITFYTGGFPAEYGGQIAALINIQNQVPPGPFHLSLSTYGGSYLTSGDNLGSKVGNFKSLNSNGQSFSLSTHSGNFGFFLSGTRDETDRRIDQPIPALYNDHGFDYFLYGKLDYVFDDHNYITSNLNFSETQTQIPFDPLEGVNYDTQNSFNGFQTLSFFHTISDEIDHEKNLFLGLYVREGGLKFKTSSYDETKQFIGNDTATAYTVDQDRKFVTYGTRIKYTNRLEHELSFTGGLSLSITAGNETFNFRDVTGNGPVNKTDFTGSDFGLFLESEIRPTEWSMIEAGVRYDQHIAPSIPMQTQVSPRAKISFFIDEANTIFLSYDRLFMPTNIEGLASIATAVGDSSTATLPERDNLYEGGIIHNFNYGISAKLSYFHKDSSPGLDDETLGSSTIRVNVNIDKVKVSGIELSLNYGNPASPFSAYLNGSLIHAYGTGPVSGGFLAPDSSTAPFDLDHDQRLSAVIGINYQPQSWFVNLVGIYGSGLANGNDDYDFKTGLFDFNQGAHTTPSWIFNISGGYIFSLGNGHSLEPSLYVTNILDHAHLIKGTFFSGASFEERRNVTLKLKYEF